MRISDWSSDVCSSDLDRAQPRPVDAEALRHADREVLDDDIGRPDQPQEEAAPFGRFQVERDRLLGAAPLQEGDAEVGLVPLLERRPARADIERCLRERVAGLRIVAPDELGRASIVERVWQYE